MIKEWCETCNGSGEGISPYSTDPEESFCEVCQGKGYTELYPYFSKSPPISLKITYKKKAARCKAEVYIKEVKEIKK